jgi:hypothetical protein
MTATRRCRWGASISLLWYECGLALYLGQSSNLFVARVKSIGIKIRLGERDVGGIVPAALIDLVYSETDL